MVYGIWFLSFPLVAKPTSGLDIKHPNYIRTVLLSKLVSYTYWPQDMPHSDTREVHICVLGSSETQLDKVASFVEILDNRESDQGLFRVNRVVLDSNALQESAKNLPFKCRIFYYSYMSAELLSAINQVAQRRGVLTVSDSKDSLKKDTMIALIEKRGKLKIFIKSKVLDSSGIRLKSSLLRIANRI